MVVLVSQPVSLPNKLSCMVLQRRRAILPFRADTIPLGHGLRFQHLRTTEQLDKKSLVV